MSASSSPIPLNSPSSFTKSCKTNSSSKTVSHYLHPDYLDPHIPLADPKQSPLALLAETLNNIGKDSTSTEVSKKTSTTVTSRTSTPISESHTYNKRECKSEGTPLKRIAKNHSDTIPLKVSTGKSWLSHSVNNSPVLQDSPAVKSPVAFSYSPARSLSSKSPVGIRESHHSNTLSGSTNHVVVSPTISSRPAISNNLSNKSASHKLTKTMDTKLPSHVDIPAASDLASKFNPCLTSSPSSFLSPSYIGYPPISSDNLGPWASILSQGASVPSNQTSILNNCVHSPGSACNDPYCLSCHVTHRVCLCVQCMHQKLVSESYSFYKNLALLGTAQAFPSGNHLSSLHSQPESSPISPSANPAALLLGKQFKEGNAVTHAATTAEYCMYCGKHCPTPEDLLQHMQLHAKADSIHNNFREHSIPQTSTNHTSVAAAAAAASLSAFNFGLYPGLNLAQKMSPLRGPSATNGGTNHASVHRFHPFRPPLPSRFAANINYPFGTSLV